MTRTPIVLTAALAALTPLAHAGAVTETATNRYVLISAEGGFNTDGPRNTAGPASGFWSIYDEANASDGGNGGSASADQDTTIDNGSYAGTLDCLATAFGDGSDFADAYGQSHFAVDFSLASAGSYTLTGWLNAFGAINGEISKSSITLTDLGNNSTVWSMSLTDGFQAFDESGSLAAGSYRLELDALAIVDRIFESGFGDANASSQFAMTIVPTPASALLLSIGGIAGAARRRR